MENDQIARGCILLALSNMFETEVASSFEGYVFFNPELLYIYEPQEWLVYTGVNVHVCVDKLFFKSYQPADEKSVMMGNSTIAKVLGYGHVDLKFSSGRVLSLHQQQKMADIQLNGHTLRSHGVKVARVHMRDWIILLLLVGIEILLNDIDPFYRFVGKDMMTDLKYPFKKSTVPLWAVPLIAILLPSVIFSAIYFRRRDVYDLHHAILGLLYAILITGVITDAIKDAVGRPRPDFFWRCFPDGKEAYDPAKHGEVICHGNEGDIKEGHKSFPSGHSSWTFAGLGFLAWYLSGKIQAFDRKGHIAKLCIIFLPLLLAALVAISRVDDYWHHWQDVFAGGILGLAVASFCYLQFFPPPYDAQGWGPHAYFRMLADQCRDDQPPNTVNSSEHHAEIDMVDSSTVLDELETGKKL